MSAEYEGEDFVVCPHCKAAIEDLFEFEGLEHDGDATSTQCPSCGGPIRLIVEVTYRYKIEVTAAST